MYIWKDQRETRTIFPRVFDTRTMYVIDVHLMFITMSLLNQEKFSFSRFLKTFQKTPILFDKFAMTPLVVFQTFYTNVFLQVAKFTCL